MMVVREERRREKDKLKAQEILLRRQKSGDESDSDEEGKGELDKHTVKNLIGRSGSTKASKEGGAAVRRAISFRTRGDAEAAQPPPELSRAVEFRQGDGVVTPPLTPDENAPDLPAAPPPMVPLGKKDNKLSSPPPKHKVEALKSDERKKRTPSFNLRKRTRSFKDKHKLPDNLPPAEMDGLLDRKQELQSGGKKATIRSWKTFHSVLFGQLLCFFKDKEAVVEKLAAIPPLNIYQAHCEVAADYTKKKHVFRLKLHDGAEFLFESSSQPEMLGWVSKINKFAEYPVDPSIDLQGTPSGAGRGRSVSPPSPKQVDPIPEGRSPKPPSLVSPSKEADNFKGREINDGGAGDMVTPPRSTHYPGALTQDNNRPSTHDGGDESQTVQLRESPRNVQPSESPRESRPTPAPRDPHPRVSPRDSRHRDSPAAAQRPMSEPMGLPPHEDHEDKDKKRKSMFSFLKKKDKKEKDHEEHDKHKDSKKHRKDKDKQERY